MIQHPLRSVQRQDEPANVIPFQPSSTPQIVLDGVSVDYPGHPDALHDINLTIRRGERVAVVGPSGSGKSTLLRTLNGLLTPSRGTRQVTLASSSLRQIGHRHPNVAMIFQEFALAQRLPVVTNVLVGCLGRASGWKAFLGWFSKEDQRRALWLIEAVGLKGYEQRRIDRLSSGQKQRVAIARALMQEQELLLADEPVASLDLQTAGAILNLLASLHAQMGFTLVIALHELEQARRYCDRVIGIRNGTVVYDGPPQMHERDIETIFGNGAAHEQIHR